MTTFEFPAYIDPAVLVPGATVRCVLDGENVILTVVKVEPALICSKPDGTGVMVLAHTVVPVDEPLRCEFDACNKPAQRYERSPTWVVVRCPEHEVY